ncbi:MAG: NUDIX hydrolase [Candidatus Omnitrophica bacterium]|nr:NUDIX hydrolase [Candidatus Omnitrophota bacterium]
MVKFKTEVSSGGVLCRLSKNNIEYALIRRAIKVWCLPKGKVEEGESYPESALREVREETGMDAVIKEELGKISYWFYDSHDRVKVSKTVYFFLMEYKSGDPKEDGIEVEEVKWFKKDEALAIMSYESEKGILNKAQRSLFLKNRL